MNILLNFKEIFKSFERKKIDTIIALLPLTLFGFILFGIKAILICLVCVAATSLFDYLSNMIQKNENVDYSKSIIGGMLLGLILPPTLPLYIVVLGCAFSVFVIKLFFCSKGGYIISPALTTRIFLQISFPNQMSQFLNPMTDISASATPLTNNIYNFKEVSFGIICGSIGETASVLIVLCGLYLIWTKVISFEIPLTILLSALISIFAFGDRSFVSLLLGGLLFASFFLCTEDICLPRSRFGKIVYGTGCGIITIIIRQFGNTPEGICYAVVFMSLIIPLINKIKFSFKKEKKVNED